MPPARAGTIAECVEYDEGMLQWGLYAGALRLPFLPTRAGLGSGVMEVNPGAEDRPLAIRRRRPTRSCSPCRPSASTRRSST